jgi:chromosome segregation ATPase
MFKLVTRMFRKKTDKPAADYQLPTDDPEVNPILVEDDGEELAPQEAATLNSQLLVPINTLDPAAMSVRTRAIVEMKNGLGDLASHIRVLGQRLHAQSMGQSKLIEALTRLPQTIKDVIPSGEAQTNALAAMKIALEDQSNANRQFVDAMKPLPEFMKSVANLPETARKQMWAITQLTEQLDRSNDAVKEQGDQVKVMVEKLASGNDERSAELSATLEQLANLQKTQVKQTTLAVKSSELARKSQRRHQTEALTTQQTRLAAMQRDQSRHFNRIEEHFKTSARRQFAMTAVAVGLAIGAVTLAVLMATGTIKLTDTSPVRTAETPTERAVDSNAVVGK